MSNWIPFAVARPATSMKVRWKCVNGHEDVGYYDAATQEFYTIDPYCLEEIAEWRPLHPPENQMQFDPAR